MRQTMRHTHPLTHPAIAAALLVAALLAALLAYGNAEAHADLVRSTPAAGDVLAESPGEVRITFTEPVAPDQSEIRVLDVRGERVDLEDARAMEGDPATMRVGVADLPDGAYTVSWRNLSTVDGHTLSGSFVFFIGSDDFSALEVDDEDGGGIPIAEPLARWATLIGLALLAGVPWVFGMVLSGALPSEDRRALRRTTERIALAGGVVVLVAGAVQLALKLNEAGDGLSLVTDTRWGNGWGLRMLLATVATAAYALGPQRLPSRGRVALIVVSIAAALSVSLTGHGAASEDIALVAGLVDAVHVLATIAWCGGLVAFLVLAARTRAERPEVLRAAIPRFTVLGATATVTLAVTGTYAAWVHVGSFDAIATTYGRGVAAKVLLLAGLVAVAAVNTTWVRQRFQQRGGGASGARWLRRLLTAEVALIAVVLLVSSTITSIEPARQQQIAEERAGGVVTESSDAGLTIRSTIQPGTVGPNALTVELLRDGTRYEDASAVQLRYGNLDTALSASTAELVRQQDGTWALADPAILTVEGVYEFAVRVQWPEGLDARQSVQFETGVDRATSRLNASAAWRWGIGALSGVGIALVAANVLASRRRVVRGEVLGWTGAAVVTVALLLWGRGPESIAVSTNPIPPTEASLAQGAQIYATHCATCHGEEFDGSGLGAAGLPAAVANLVLHFPQHSDGQHFAVISNGRPASGMPAWEGTLTDEEIWNVINYLRAETEARAPRLQGQ